MSFSQQHKRFDCHMHTPLCGHAVGSPEAYVESAARQGISLITFTCHIPMHGNGYSQEGIRMRHADIPNYRKMVQQARELGEELGVEVLYGIEAEISPEPEEIEQMSLLIDAEPFDFVLGSLHHMLPIWDHMMRREHISSDSEKIQYYFENLASGAESGLYDSIAHPDVIRLYGTLSGSFRPSEHETVIKEALDRIAATPTFLEINTSGLIKGDFTVHPDPLVMEWALEREIPFTIGSDSHTPDRVGADFDEVIEQFQSIGLRALHYFKQRKHVRITLD